MTYDVKQCAILQKEWLNDTVYSVVVDAGKLAEWAKAGQFVNILVPGKTLRRPISICEIDKEKQTLRLVIEVRGEGTRQLSDCKVGDTLDILAPLGNGFTLEDTSKKAVFVGGGIGVPPLLEPCKAYGKNATVVLGFRSEKAMILTEDFAKTGATVKIATDDGSYGHHGLVTDCLQGVEADIVYACGPTPMLNAVANYAKDHGMECQVSMEERMACGIGACLGCAIQLYDANGNVFMGHVCKNGPVFDSNQIVW